MLLRKLILENFRNYKGCEIEAHPGINMFIGSNGSGKSNLMEAIFLVAVGKSPWTNENNEMVNLKSPK